MAHTKVRGYNILLTIGGKSITGTTSDTFAGGGKMKESIQKSDVGFTQYTNTGYEGTINVSSYVGNGTAATGEMNIEAILTACRDNTTGTFAIAFGTTGGDPKVTGSCTFLSCTVNSDSEEYSNCTIDLSVTSVPLFTTV
jgi:hypothetical protein